MSILYLLIPLAVGLMAVAIAFFLWTVRTGQYDKEAATLSKGYDRSVVARVGHFLPF